MAEITDPILREAAGLDPILKAVTDSDMLKAPAFTTAFNSPAFPALNGDITIRYATVGDTLKIEALSMGGGGFAEAIATLQICIDKAPASWYRPSTEGGKPPVLDLARIPDAEALVALYREFSIWRETFRLGGK